jgi:pimeloyl-ACP methyl ester carboxylesterase
MQDGTHLIIQKPPAEIAKRECVILVHGLGHYNFAWLNWEERLLAEGYTVLSYDLIGRGLSNYSINEQFGLEEHLEQLHAMVNIPAADTKVDAIHIVGHSQGGAIVLGFGAAFSESIPKIKTVVLLAPAGLMSGYLLKLLQSGSCVQSIAKGYVMDPASQRDSWRNGFMNKDSDICERQQAYLDALHFDDARSCSVFDAIWGCLTQFPFTSMQEHLDALAQAARTGSVKVTVCWGQEDPTVPFSDHVHFLRSFAGVEDGFTFHAYPGAGHELTLEDFEVCYPDVLAAIQRI